MAKKWKEQKEPPLLTAKQKILIRIAMAAALIVFVFLQLGKIHDIGVKMIQGSTANALAISEMMKACQNDAQGAGLKGQEFTDAWNACVAEGHKNLKEKSKK